jgi:protein-disulfide isomerase
MLSNEPDVELLSDADSLILGNVEAPVTLTIVSNPFCLPCARAHKTIDDWIESKGDIKVQVVFSTSNRDGDKKTTIARSLIQIGLDNDNLKKAAVNEWYGGGNFNSENWLSKYRPREDDQSKDKIQKHTDWCHKVKIAATPTFFINGKKLPSIWQLDDIKYII